MNKDYTRIGIKAITGAYGYSNYLWSVSDHVVHTINPVNPHVDQSLESTIIRTNREYLEELVFI